MSRTASLALITIGALLVIGLATFMARIVGQWEVEDAKTAARREAAQIAVDAVSPALEAVRTAAEEARLAADAAQAAVAEAAGIAEAATEQATRDIAARIAEETFRKMERESAHKAEEKAAAEALVAVRQRAATADYNTALWDPLHFAPQALEARDEQCLVCHQDVLDSQVRDVSPAGVDKAETLAWYQTLDTYSGDQLTFHQRHIASPYAKEVMNLSCNFCHLGIDPREEAPQTPIAPALTQLAVGGAQGDRPAFTLRKSVDPSETCLRCHGSFPWQVMEGLAGPWHEVRGDLEAGPTDNGCLVCHGKLFRTTRHQVTYLHGERIEELAQQDSDVCYGCHGGRAWYRTSYPYPRHAWPDMPEAAPDWAQGRPTESDPRYRIPAP